jgi:hypothetical protein
MPLFNRSLTAEAFVAHLDVITPLNKSTTLSQNMSKWIFFQKSGDFYFVYG